MLIRYGNFENSPKKGYQKVKILSFLQEYFKINCNQNSSTWHGLDNTIRIMSFKILKHFPTCSFKNLFFSFLLNCLIYKIFFFKKRKKTIFSQPLYTFLMPSCASPMCQEVHIFSQQNKRLWLSQSTNCGSHQARDTKENPLGRGHMWKPFSAFSLIHPCEDNDLKISLSLSQSLTFPLRSKPLPFPDTIPAQPATKLLPPIRISLSLHVFRFWGTP